MVPYRAAPERLEELKMRPSLAPAAKAVLIAIVIAPANFFVYFALYDNARRSPIFWVPFAALAIAQTLLGFYGSGAALKFLLAPHADGGDRFRAVVVALAGIVIGLGGVLGGFLGWVFSSGMNLMGGAWGRPLRVRGKQLHPEVREGSDWTSGDRPDPRGLDDATRSALEALWLHDAQKEHASVPAFSRVSWILAAVAAPPELVEWAHRAALEEADHTRRCFALAAGYGGRTHSVEPMPDLLIDGALSVRGDAYETLAVESLEDGCLLEDFNADVAAECARGCEEPVTRATLQQIAVEERAHAELSWSILEWVVARRGAKLTEPLHRAIARLDRVARPTAASTALLPLVDAADQAALLRHGRLPDARWSELWDARLVETRRRAQRLGSPRPTSVSHTHL